MDKLLTYLGRWVSAVNQLLLFLPFAAFVAGLLLGQVASQGGRICGGRELVRESLVVPGVEAGDGRTSES